MRSGCTYAISAVVLAAVVLLVPMVFEDTDAASHEIPTEVDVEMNCNFHALSFSSDKQYDDTYTVVYSAFGVLPDGKTIDLYPTNVPSAPDWYVSFSPDEVGMCKTVYITQQISKDTDVAYYVMKVNILKSPEEGKPFLVKFFDGYSGKVYYTVEVDSNFYAPADGYFIYPPEPPSRPGYSFIGWFTDLDNNVMFDPRQPVESDVNVFGKWMYSGFPDTDVPGSGPSEGASLVSITIEGNYETDYQVGDRLNTTGLFVFALYSDGYKEEVTSKSTFTPTKFDNVGNLSVMVFYKNLSASFNVDVSENVPDVDPDGPETPDNPDSPGIPDGTDRPDEGGISMTEYLLIAVVILLAVALIVVILHRRST